jgi:general secretion pathway protein G
MKLMRTRESGFTFVELLVVTALVGILAMVIMPLAKVAMQRQREIELRRALRELRTAIDHYKDAADQGKIPATSIRAGSEGYPPDLETLVVGVRSGEGATEKRLKFLRRIPSDPITRSKEWGLRAYEDRPDSKSWGGQDVYDVYSKSDGVALDGTKYSDW